MILPRIRAPPLHGAVLEQYPQYLYPTNREKETPMASLTRLTVDLVTDEELSQRRMDTLARELTDHLHVIGVEDEDQAHAEVDKHVRAHVHDTSDGDRCTHCVELSLDYRSGDAVLGN